MSPQPEQIFSPRIEIADNVDDMQTEMQAGLDVEVASENDDDEIAVEFLERSDGSLTDMAALSEAREVPEFGDNLAEFMSKNDLLILSDDLVSLYDIDKRSRSEWEQTYVDGLDLLGLKIEDRTCPWDGAFGAHHPLLAEAVVKFQSETIVETFPAQGPAKTKIIGDITPEREEAAKRVREDMNHTLTDRMPEYRPEHEKLLWSLPIAGSAFKKVFFDPARGRETTQFVPAEDFIVPFGATDLITAPRYTHRMRKTENEIRKLMESGFYVKEPVTSEVVGDVDDIDEAKNEHTGLDGNEDTRPLLLEMHVDIDLAGFEDISDESGMMTGIELPYVVTIEKSTGSIFSIYRNYEENDKLRQKRVHFSHYTYIPGFGFYGFGLIHLVGGFAKGATSVMRQLVDAGTLSNLPGGFRTRGFRIKGGDAPIAPGEFRETDVATGTLKDNIMPLPFKEPSIVLFELLKSIVDEGRRFAAVSDVNIADMQPNAPVGSTLAILERTLKTMTAIQARVHFAMKAEFQILKKIAAEMAPADYDYDAIGEPGQQARKGDYSIVEIIPVSDPNSSSMSQRIVQYQAALQLMQMKPQIYDEQRVHRSMLDTLGFKDSELMVPDTSKIPMMDPITENMNILNSNPVEATQTQDHEAHLAVHTAFQQDPQIMGMIQQQGPKAQQIMGAMMSHMNEHIAFAYRQKIEQEMGQPMPPIEQQLDPQQEVQLSQITAQAARQLTGKAQQEVQQQQQQQEAQDPLNIIQRGELEIKQADQALKEKTQQDEYKLKQGKLMIDAATAEKEDQLEQDKLTAKVMELTKKDKLARDSKLADVDIEEARLTQQDRTAQRQERAATAAANKPAEKPQEKK